MSEVANTLTLTAYSQFVAESAPSYAHSDIQQHLWHLQHQNAQQLMSEVEKDHVYGWEILSHLGEIARCHYFGHDELVVDGNPKLSDVEVLFDSLSPNAESRVLSAKIGGIVLDVCVAELGLPQMMISPILYMPELRDELLDKVAVARQLFVKRQSMRVSGMPFYDHYLLTSDHSKDAFRYVAEDLRRLVEEIRD